MELLAVVVGAAAGLIGGAAVPSLIRWLPEPVDDADEVPDPSPVRLSEPPPDRPSGEDRGGTYPRLAAAPRLALHSSVAGALAGVLIGLALGWSWLLAVWLPLIGVGTALAYVDWRIRLLPRLLVLPATGYVLVVVGIAALATSDLPLLVRTVVGMLAARTVFWLMWFIRSAGMGFGDVRLAALAGAGLAAVGWAELVAGVYAGMVLFGVSMLGLALWRRDRGELGVPRPYGPFLLLGVVLGLALAEPVRALFGG